MAFALRLSGLTQETRYKISTDFTIQENKSQYNPKPRYYRCYDPCDDIDVLYLPLGSWRSELYKNLILNHKNLG
jgi:hypothetical protein